MKAHRGDYKPLFPNFPMPICCAALLLFLLWGKAEKGGRLKAGKARV